MLKHKNSAEMESVMKTDAHYGLSKKRILKAMPLISAVLTLLMFSGCGSDDSVTVTAEQNDLISEYIAGTLMKYSYQNEWKYIKLNDNITNFERPSQSTVIPEPGSSNPNNPTQPATGSAAAVKEGTMADLAAALKLDGITVSYAGCVVGKSYPNESDVFVVKATSGRDIAAVEFNLKNTSDNTVVCNTAQLSLVMRLSVNKASNITEYATILKNDLNMLSDVSIAPGEDFKAVVLFMVAEGSADNISSLDLILSEKGSVLSNISLK